MLLFYGFSCNLTQQDKLGTVEQPQNIGTTNLDKRRLYANTHRGNNDVLILTCFSGKNMHFNDKNKHSLIKIKIFWMQIRDYKADYISNLKNE